MRKWIKDSYHARPHRVRSIVTADQEIEFLQKDVSMGADLNPLRDSNADADHQIVVAAGAMNPLRSVGVSTREVRGAYQL